MEVSLQSESDYGSISDGNNYASLPKELLLMYNLSVSCVMNLPGAFTSSIVRVHFPPSLFFYFNLFPSDFSNGLVIPPHAPSPSPSPPETLLCSCTLSVFKLSCQTEFLTPPLPGAHHALAIFCFCALGIFKLFWRSSSLHPLHQSPPLTNFFCSSTLGVFKLACWSAHLPLPSPTPQLPPRQATEDY